MITQLVLNTDMKGYKALSISNADEEDFNAIALDTQNFVSTELLGDELYNDFSSDIDTGSGVPTEQKYLDLLNGVTWTEIVNEDDLTQNVIHNNKGLKNAWNYFVYREWLNQVPFVSNFTGKKTNNSINGETLSRQSLNVETQNRYNKGVDVYETVRSFVEYYKEFKQDYTNLTIVTTNPTTTTYRIDLASTTYLKDGDTMTLDGLDYTVLSLIADTSIEFIASNDVTFSDDYIYWHPFEDAANCEKGKLYFNGMF
jgi:hypothetical protein